MKSTLVFCENIAIENPNIIDGSFYQKYAFNCNEGIIPELTLCKDESCENSVGQHV